MLLNMLEILPGFRIPGSTPGKPVRRCDTADLRARAARLREAACVVSPSWQDGVPEITSKTDADVAGRFGPCRGTVNHG